LKALHTPGHTLESTCFLLSDENEQALCIFTGDTLFIGDVGRPDLAIKSDLTQDQLAGMLYDSLRTKILPLPGHIIVYPAHGAGSACGKNMSKETSDTLGSQKEKNYALRNISREQFIKELTEGILPPPQYFAKNAALNMQGYQEYNDVVAKGTRALTPAEFEAASSDKRITVLDVRQPEEFANEHIAGSLFIGLDGQFAPWAGTLINDLRAPILLVAPNGREEEAVMRLSRVGYDNCIGFLKGGLKAWKDAGKTTENIQNITPEEFLEQYSKKTQTLDVRKPSEFEAAHLKNAISVPLDFISDWIYKMNKSNPYMVHCAGGYRSMITISILKANGFRNLRNVTGGFGAISKLDAAQQFIVKEPVAVK
jgi:rhodanese-related sulfurtransferase